MPRVASLLTGGTMICANLMGSQQTPEIYDQPKANSSGDYLSTVRCRKDNDQSQGNTAADVTELNLALKSGCVYSFSYDLLYSTSGLLVGCQFAVDYTGPTLLSIGYGMMMCTIANAVVSDATTTRNTFLGTTASVAGGGPKWVRVFGGLKTGGTTGGDLKLRMQATGVLGVTATLLANSCGKAEEQ